MEDVDIIVVGCSLGFHIAYGLQFVDGIRDIYLVDFDIVENRNLNRLPFAVGKYKVEEAKKFIVLKTAHSVVDRISADLIDLVRPQIVIDCTDTLQTQQELYQWCGRRGVAYLRVGSEMNRVTIARSSEGVWEEGTEGGRCDETVRQLPETQLVAAAEVIKFMRGFLAGEKEPTVRETEVIYDSKR